MNGFAIKKRKSSRYKFILLFIAGIQAQSCDPGFYLDNTNTCVQCPIGQSCDNTNAANCPSNQVSELGNNKCYSCAVNGVVPSNNDEICEYCPAGSFSTDTQTICTTCNDNEYSNVASASCTQCIAGTKPDTNQNTCIECTSGNACPSGKEVACTGTSYSKNGAAACTTCPAGFVCTSTGLEACPAGTIPDGAGGCEPCAAGTFGTTGSNTCTPCPRGYYCPSVAANSPTLCPEGTYTSSSGSTECTLCPAGSSCEDPTQNPSNCVAPGQYSLEGDGYCKDCPVGYKCASNNNSPVKCQSGEYGLNGVCTKCENEQYCTSVITYIKSGQECQPGNYLVAGNNGNIGCLPCPAGYSCETPSNNPVACTAGTFAHMGSTECSNCPAGYECTTKEIFNMCPFGTYSNNGVCTLCDTNKVCTDGVTSTDCAPGFYRLDYWQTATCIECPAGYACDSTATQAITECQAGFYSDAGADTCSECDAGYTCATVHNNGPAPFEEICPMGFYCDHATRGGMTKCPAGKYNPNYGTTAESDCLDCPEGFVCEGPTTNTVSSYLSGANFCPPGYWCEAAQTDPQANPCPVGTFQDKYNQVTEDACKVCPLGTYTDDTGQVTCKFCDSGYYCPLGTDGKTSRTECPAGTYTEETGSDNLEDCKLCETGHFCPAGLTAAGFTCTAGGKCACNAGTFNDRIGQQSDDQCKLCYGGTTCSTAGLAKPDGPCGPGSFCPLGSVIVTAPAATAPVELCPSGTYTKLFNATSVDDCLPCEPGYYCNEGTGSATVQPILCDPGKYCPGHNDQNGPLWGQIDCPAGSYNDGTGLKDFTECKVCPEGKYCVAGTSDLTGLDCPTGYYCPEGTKFDTEYPCPAGYYNDQLSQVALDNCKICDPGYYCDTGSSSRTSCDPGFYNPVYSGMNSTACLPCPAGMLCQNANTFAPVACPPGSYSAWDMDNGVVTCTACEKGFYCPPVGLNYEIGVTDTAMRTKYLCPSGLYCGGGVDVIPTDTDHSCSLGYYCPEAIEEEQPCPPGTYSKITGLESVEECQVCPQGYYCEGTAAAPVGPKNPAPCGEGNYCPGAPDNTEGQSQPIPCPKGYYQKNPAEAHVSLDSCHECPAGFYCPNEGTVNPVDCPMGDYCVPGLIQPLPCPPGTIGTAENLKTQSQCEFCPGGKYCEGYGKTNYTDVCSAGFYCIKGASQSTPGCVGQNYCESGINGGICPAGSYCPEDTTNPIPCSDGTFSTIVGAKEPGECQPCPPGKYCLSGIIQGDCAEGFYCTGGSSTPEQNDCTTGHYCENGSPFELDCPPGTYQDATKAPNCKGCTAGFTCPVQAINTDPENYFTLNLVCPEGFYCLGFAATTKDVQYDATNPIGCAAGTYYNSEAAKVPSDCIACDAGKFCPYYGLDEPTSNNANASLYNDFDCAENYYCSGSSTQIAPMGTAETFGGMCEPGYSCAAGSSSPTQTACQAGTFNPREGGQCRACLEGQACTSQHLSSPDKTCQAGYYCESGADDDTPTTPTPSSNPTFGPCSPDNTVCQAGSVNFQRCPSGSKANLDRINCDSCPVGNFCYQDTIETLSDVVTGIESCSPGYYCPTDTGYVLPECPPGKYASSLTNVLTSELQCTACDQYSYCDNYALIAVSGTCADGFYCSDQSNITPYPFSTTTTNTICEAGYYCTNGESDPCPIPTYRAETGGNSLSSCHACPSGYKCETTALTDLTPYICEAGSYCESGSATPCETGTYCPETGTMQTSQIDCGIGTSNNQTGQIACTNCAAGSYTETQGKETCDNCSAGHYCETGTSIPQPCAPGTYSAVGGLASQSACTVCPGGSYCEGDGLAQATGKTAEGFYSEGGAKQEEPIKGTTTDTGGTTYNFGPCEQGSYCTTGSDQQNPCAAGFYCDTEMNNLQSPSGKTCAAGFYCEAGSISEFGATNAAPESINPCAPGYYCPAGSATEDPCNVGTYSSTPGLSDQSECLACPAGFYCDIPGSTSVNITACPEGFYCDTTGISSSNSADVKPCDTEHQCPTGTVNQIACPQGEEQPLPNQATCNACPAGLYCPGNGDSSQTCPQGFYCDGGTAAIDSKPCPPGTYADNNGYTNYTECLACAEGKYCEGGATPEQNCQAGYNCPPNSEFATQELCPPGYFCESGVAKQACGQSTFSAKYGLENSTQCEECPRGSLCTQSALLQPDVTCADKKTSDPKSTQTTCKDCSSNYYCLEGYTEEIMCAEGTTSTSGQSVCTPCPAGKQCYGDGTSPADCEIGGYCQGNTGNYNTPCPQGTRGTQPGQSTEANACTSCDTDNACPSLGSTSQTPCASGYICTAGATSIYENECPQGSYCSSGITQSCPTNTWSDIYAKKNSSECMNVPPGKQYKDSTTPGDDCDAGFYCSGSGNKAQCSEGHYCPAGTLIEVPCGIGTYSDIIGQDTCDACTANNYCTDPAGTINPQSCIDGANCNATMSACEPGLEKDNGGCKCCDEGFACDLELTFNLNGSPTVTETKTICDNGYYCAAGTIITKPESSSDQASQCVVTGQESGLCPPGFYCNNAESNSTIQCPVGKYCAQPGLSAPEGDCNAGYYCSGGATSPEFELCPEGFYCEAGTTSPSPCPDGKYGANVGLKSENECTVCDKGYTCINGARTRCTAGNYCYDPAISGITCPAGFACPEGSYLPTPCYDSTYQPNTGQTTCEPCPAGKSCPIDTTETIGTETLQGCTTDVLCPAGYFCESNEPSKYCPIGTFAEVASARSDSTSCTLCTEKFYCPDPGMTDGAVNACYDGYQCPAGAASGYSSASDAQCPQSKYCVAGTPATCDIGSFSTVTTYAYNSTCSPCPAGYFCDPSDSVAINDRIKECTAGFYCAEGTSSELECNKGYYCPAGAPSQFTCPQGTYAPLTKQNTACNPCPTDEFCPGGPPPNNQPGDCGAGYYCPTGDVRLACPPGTFSTDTAASDISTCQNCTAGFYCDSEGMSDISTNLCFPGFYCPEGSTVGDQNPCPAGHFCPEGTAAANENECQSGTYNPLTMQPDASDCIPCDTGYACPNTAMTAVGSPCDAGYFCYRGASSVQPTLSGSFTDDKSVDYFGPCDAGNYCPQGSGYPLPCPGGQWTTNSVSACSDCLAGTYCPYGDANNPITTDAGYYSLSGQEYQTPCPAGYFATTNPDRSLLSKACQLCTAGSYCDSTALTSVAGDCQAGFYCPEGSRSRTANSCPTGAYCPLGSPAPTLCDPGKYCPNIELAAVFSDCQAGYFCDVGASDPTNNGKECSEGHYCPAGTTSEIACSAGTYRNKTAGIDSDSCIACPAGYYCPNSAQTQGDNSDFICPSGYFCPEGLDKSPTSFIPSTTYLCPTGYKCPTGSVAPIPCPPGQSQISQGQATCNSCPTRYFCPKLATNTQNDCPLGYTCNGGNTIPDECSAGTYGSRINACSDCDAGTYCPSTAMVEPTAGWSTYYCQAGFYCPRQSTSPQQENCGPGYYCEKGTLSKKSSPAGTFQPIQNAKSVEDLLQCPSGKACITSNIENTAGMQNCSAGYYCSGGATSSTPTDGEGENSTGNSCKEGFYCPESSGIYSENPCPAGTYQSNIQASDNSSCTPCTGGSSCNSPGLATPNDNCATGYFCPEGSDNNTNSECQAGNYCPENSENQIVCDPGFITLQTKEAECQACPAGKICDTGVISDCTTGNYCPLGSDSVTACPVGTFNNQTNLEAESQCQLCTEGKYCQFAGRDSEEGNCTAGYYCPLGSSRSTETPCPPGAKCPEGSGAFEICQPGDYSISSRQSTCEVCYSNHYCPGLFLNTDLNNLWTGTKKPLKCPKGHYCLDGAATASKCPKGTFNQFEYQGSIDGCLPCTEGQYCAEEGLEAPTGDCDEGCICLEGSQESCPDFCRAGTYCDQGINTPCPAGYACPEDKMPATADYLEYPCEAGYYCPESSTNTTSVICPTGNYCPSQAPEPTKCPAGTYNPNQNQVNTDACLACPAGKYCDVDGLSTFTGPCLPGDFCPEGSINGRLCSEENSYQYCPGDTSTPINCPSGQIATTDQTACEDCVAGIFCEENEPPTDCPVGFYCTQGTPQPIPCPNGKIGLNSGLTQESECSDCTAGMFCWEPGLEVTPTDQRLPCSQGYDCTSGGQGTPDAILCPVGYYCPENNQVTPKVTEKTPCPVGTYNDVEGLYQEADCKQCIPGYKCDSLALVTPVDLCDAGYYCPLGSTNTTKQDCPRGNYCPTGTADPLLCKIGTYNPDLNQAVCLPCNDGKECGSSGLVNENDCSEGKYCQNQEIIPCPAGTYNPNRGAASVADCTTCDPFKFCEGGSDAVTGDCYPGYDCTDGGFALGNPANHLCPEGHYCTNGEPVQCPEGTYRNKLGATAVSDCYPCTAGFMCAAGTVNPTVPCPAGNYCEPGTSINNGGLACLSGFHCPESSPTSLPCEPGTFTDQTGQSTCKDCAAGFYCEPQADGSSVQIDCPEKSYCPAKSYEPTTCPDGTYGDTTNLESADQCTSCGSNYYCIKGINGVAASTDRKCRPGFLCLRKMSSPTPTAVTYNVFGAEYNSTDFMYGLDLDAITKSDLDSLIASGQIMISQSWYTDTAKSCDPDETTECGGVCPPGYYCPQQSSNLQVLPCPAYRSFTSNVLKLDPTNPKRYLIDDTNPGARFEDECSICPPGFVCIQGIPIPIPCPLGYYCPNSNFKQCYESDPPDSTCPEGDSECPTLYVPCPVNTYNPETGASNIDSCLPCPEDFLCNTEGTAFPTQLCPDGYYCPGGGVAEQLCPAGEYSSQADTNGACEKCDPGYYCEEPSVGNLNTNAQMNACDAGFECPAGSSRGDVPCAGGYYCEAASDKIPCPAGYFCPEGSASYINNPCDYPYFCAEGQAQPYYCPAGSIPLQGSFARVNATVACELCPATTYKANLPDETCTQCPEGYFCPVGTGDYTQNPCPLGFTCPAGSAEATPCAIGTFGTMVESNLYAICSPCPAETYQNREGQLSCNSCGSAATTYTETGLSTCTCKGVNRIFQNSDASCICKPETSYQPLGTEENEDNSKEACSQITYERCGGNQARISSSLECLDISSISCSDTCANPKFDNILGTCTCEYNTDLSGCTGTSCIENSVTVDPATNQITLKSTDSEGNTIDQVLNNAFYGPSYEVFAENVNKTAQIVYFSQTDVQGLYTTGSNITARTARSVDQIRLQKIRGKRQASNATVAIPNVSNPILCVEQYDPVVFFVNRDTNNFPVYSRNDLRNTNPSFDYGDFRNLQFNILSSALEIDSFTYVFTPTVNRENLDEVYVFVDYAYPTEREVVIAVKTEGGCSAQPPIQAQTEATYRNLAVEVAIPESLTFPVEIIIGVVAAGVVIILIGCFIWFWYGPGRKYLNKKPWEKWADFMPKYHILDEPIYNLPNWLNRENKKIEKFNDKLAMKYSKNQINQEALEQEVEDELALKKEQDPLAAYKDPNSFLKAADALIVAETEKDVDELTTKAFVDKLEDQNIYVASVLANHNQSMKEYHERLKMKAAGLDKLFDDFMNNKYDNFGKSSSSFSSSSSSSSASSISDQENFMPDTGSNTISDKKQVRLLNDLIKMLDSLNKGNINLSNNAKDEALKKLHKKQQIGDEDQNTNLLVKQALDQFNKLQEDLANEEARDISEKLFKIDDKHRDEIEKFNKNLKKKLKDNGANEDEVDKILSAHNEDLAKLKNKLAKEKENEMSKLRAKLAKRREQKERRLARQQRNLYHEAEIDMDLLPKSNKIPEHVIANIENQIEAMNSFETSLAKKELDKMDGLDDKNSSLNNKKQALLKSLEEAGQLDAEKLDLINKQFENYEKSRRRVRNHQLDKLRNRMKHGRKKKTDALDSEHNTAIEKIMNSTPSKEILDQITEYHDNEKSAIRKELENLEKQEESDLVNNLKQSEEQNVDNLVHDILNQIGVSLPTDKANEILSKYNNEVNNMNELHELNKKRQRAELANKMRKRRNHNLIKLQKDLKNNEQDQANDRLDNVENKLLEKSAEKILIEEGLQSATNNAVNSNNQAYKNLEEKFKKEKDDLNKELLAEDEKDRNKFNEDMNAQKLKELRELHQKQQAEIAQEKRNNNGNIDEELLNKIMQDHMEQEKMLLDNFNRKKSKQRAALNERLAKRMANKKQILTLNQQSEKAALAVNDVEKKLDEKAELLKSDEVKKLEEAGNNTSDIVKLILNKRHNEEIANLEKVFKLKQQQAIIEAKLNTNKKYNLLREKLDEELANNPNISAKEKLEKLNELQENKNNELANNIQNAETENQLEFTKAMMTLKDKHYQEMVEAIIKYADDAGDQEEDLDPEEMKQIQEKLEAERIERQKLANEELANFEKEEEIRKKKELEEYEKELQAEFDFEASKMKLKQEQLNQEEAEFQLNQRANLRKKIEEARAYGASESEQKRIMEQFERDKEIVSKKYANNKQQLQKNLQDQINRRKKLQMAEKKKEINEDSNQRKRIMQKQKNDELIEQANQEISQLENREKISSRRSSTVSASQVAGSSPVNFVQSMKRSLSTISKQSEKGENKELYDAYHELNRLLKSLKEQQKELFDSKKLETIDENKYNKVIDTTVGYSYDSQDLTYEETSISTNGKIIPLPINQLNNSALLCYEFLNFINTLLTIKLPNYPRNISLLTAKTLPMRKTLDQPAGIELDVANKAIWISIHRLNNNSVNDLAILMIKVIVNNFVEETEVEDKEGVYSSCLEVLTADVFKSHYQKKLEKHQKKQQKTTASAAKSDVASVASYELHIDQDTDFKSEQTQPRAIPSVPEMVAKIKKFKEVSKYFSAEEYLNESSELLILLNESLNLAQLENNGQNLNPKDKLVNKALKNREYLMENLSKKQ